VTGDGFHIPANGCRRKVGFHLLNHPVHRRLIQRALVSLESQQVVSAISNNLRRDVLLTARRIDGHRRVLQLDIVKQFRNCRDFFAVASCPRLIPRCTDQALTRNRGPRLSFRLWERRKALPSIAITSCSTLLACPSRQYPYPTLTLITPGTEIGGTPGHLRFRGIDDPFQSPRIREQVVPETGYTSVTLNKPAGA
jgi:hypothetical protein